MLSVAEGACGSSRSPNRVRRGIKHAVSPLIQRKFLNHVTIDNERTALPNNVGGKVPVLHTPFSEAFEVHSELGRCVVQPFSRRICMIALLLQLHCVNN